MKIKQVTRKVYNIHKDQPLAILKCIFTNYFYALSAMSVPTMISLQSDIGVITSMACYYAFLVILLTRPAYETGTGKFYFWLSMVAGGFSGYKICSYLIQFL